MTGSPPWCRLSTGVLHSLFLQSTVGGEAAVRAQRRREGAAAVERERVGAAFPLYPVHEPRLS